MDEINIGENGINIIKVKKKWFSKEITKQEINIEWDNITYVSFDDEFEIGYKDRFDMDKTEDDKVVINYSRKDEEYYYQKFEEIIVYVKKNKTKETTFEIFLAGEEITKFDDFWTKDWTKI